MTYTERDLLAEFDKLLPSILNLNGIHRNNSGNPIRISIDPHTLLNDQLIADGYLVPDPDDSDKFILTAEGRFFIMRGGYKAKYQYDEYLRKLNEQQIQSVIDTNESVKSTNQFQKRILWVTLIVSAISLIVSIVTAAIQVKQMQLP